MGASWGAFHMISTARPPNIPLAWSRLLGRLRWVGHPITIFVALQIVWLAITLIWVLWFVGVQDEIAAQMKNFGRELFDSGTTVAMMVVGCVLLGVLGVGTIVLFIFGQRQTYLARQQRTFVSSVTHELKSPLASLQLSADTLGARQLNEEQKTRLLDMITTDIDRLKRLVDQILVAGSLDRGILAFDDEERTVDVLAVISKVCENLSYLDPSLRQRIVTESEGPTFEMYAPPAALMLILHNLIENAVKYSPHDAPIVVTVERDGSQAFFAVRDQGLGMDRKDLRRVFRMFHRSDAALKKAIPGTGLGLFIVRSAARILGGRVWAESVGRGKGAVFYVSLPMAARNSSKVI